MITDGSINNATESDDDEDVAQESPTRQTPSQGTASPAAAAEDLQAKLAEADKKYLYLYSEFENFRRRNERERIDFLKFGHEGFLKELLQVLDNFERALTHAKSLGGEKGTPLAQVVQGIEMIAYQYAEAMKAQGVTPINSVGQKFDPALHEAAGEEEVKGAEAGSVVKEMLKGYMLHGRLLRAARVILAKK